ncbi:unnamed protein product [Amaranthus hypochondriacus]
MACFGLDAHKNTRLRNAFFERSSPGLLQILLQQFRAQKAKEIDHHLYEFGSVEYHVQCCTSDPHNLYISISTPILASGSVCSSTTQKVKDIAPNVVDILHEPRHGYQLTLQLNLARIPPGKGGVKILKKIAAIESVILSSQLKEMLGNFSTENASECTSKPIRIVYRPGEPFFVLRQPQKVTVVFPMRFKETSDVVIATSFFQELMDIGNSEAFSKAPQCTWTAIPPPELRGSLIEDLSTNGGFVSFDIFSRHVDDKRLENTVWNLLKFYTYVKYYIKSTKSFIQRKMRSKLEDLVKVLNKPEHDDYDHEQQDQGCGWKMKQVSSSKIRKLKKQYGDFKRKINRMRYRIRVQGINEMNRKIKRIHHQIKIRNLGLHRRWFSTPRFHSANGYTRLE